MERKREDNFNDIVAKAMKGKSLGKRRLAELLSCSHQDIQNFIRGEWDVEIAELLCPLLDLHFHSLRKIGEEQSVLPEEPVYEGLHVLTSSFTMSDGYPMSVNAFILEVGDGQSILVDTGVDPLLILQTLERNELQLRSIFITHEHPDHVYGLDQVVENSGCSEIWIDQRESSKLGQSVQEDQVWGYEKGQLRSVSTSGHTQGGRTWIWESVDGATLAFVGDAFFYGSIGGVPSKSYGKALAEIREGILSLPDETIICPGHGILSSVKEEKLINPFFAKSV